MTYPYPPVATMDELKDIISGVASGQFATAHEAHCGWAIAGFGLSKLMPDSPAPTVAADHAALAAHLTESHTAALGGAGLNINWKIFLPILLQLLQGWLKTQGA